MDVDLNSTSWASSQSGAAARTAEEPPETPATSATSDSSATSAPSPESSSSASASGAEESRAFPPPAPRPTQTGAEGIRFDFNFGARVAVPPGEWRVQLRDLDTGNILFDQTVNAAGVNSSKRYYVRFGIEVWNGKESVLKHDYDARDREVLVTLPVGTIGDTVGWLPYVDKFQKKHGCKLTCAMAERLIPLFDEAYPDIRFITHEQVEVRNYYATYNVGLFFDDADFVMQPTDFRHVGLHRTAGYILGVDPTESPPRVVIPDDSRPVEEPYVCIAVQASTYAKKWNNPFGWRGVIGFLKERGYRVICIDRDAAHGQGTAWTHIPHGAEDQTGDIPLAERLRWLRHADAFVGVSSGLAWLAWAVGCKVVMISGFTHPNNEFETPGRVINWHTCNGCWNDVRHRFDHKDFLWCPRHKGTSREYECSRLITAEQVNRTIASVLGIEPMRPEAGA